MLGVIVDEKKLAEEILQYKKSKKGIGKNISLMVKYYYIVKNITDKQELKEKIFELLKKKYEGFKRGKWEKTVDRSVTLFLKNVKFKKEDKVNNERDFFPNKEFVKIENVKITNNELQYIKQLDDKNLEKIAFTMLVYAKITNCILREDLNWVGQSITNIFKEAKVNLKGKDKELLLHKLYNTKLKEIEIIDKETGEIITEDINYISMPKSNSKNSFKINYADYNNGKEDDIEITIEDFNSVIYYYLIWKGEKWKKCENCKSRWFKPTNNKSKYCAKCAKEIKNEQNKIYYNISKNADI